MKEENSFIVFMRKFPNRKISQIICNEELMIRGISETFLE